MTTLVFFLEEPSAEAMLKSLLPRILPDEYQFQYVVFEGKSDLEKRLVMRLREWQKPDCRFIILRDQDSADCVAVKAGLRRKCQEGRHPEALVRIACHELESWYLGDLLAVEYGLGLRNLGRQQGRGGFRNPDTRSNPAEVLKNLTKGRYQKVAGSRQIGEHLEVMRNRSYSFRVFVEGLLNLCRDTE